MLGTTQHRMGADHEYATQVAVALLGDRTELAFAAGRILSRHKPDPGRKVTTRSERLRVSDNGRDRCRTNKAYSGDRPKSLAVAIRAMLPRDPLLERADQRL